MRIIVVHSGTSVDGIDTATVEITAADAAEGGAALTMTVLRSSTAEWDDDIRAAILDAALGGTLTIGDVARLDAAIGSALAAVARAEVEAGDGADLVVSPGQTLFHWVDDGVTRGTLQLGDPSRIAEATGLPVVSQLRSADIAAGGHGAPLMPLFDTAWLQTMAVTSAHPIVTLNLGGIANLSVVRPDGRVSAWDTGPANGLIDAVISRASSGRNHFDAGGQRAATGNINTRLLDELLSHPYFSSLPPKSTGRETFDLGVVDDALERAGCPSLDLESVVATLTRLTARTVADAVSAGFDGEEQRPERVLVSGGGVHNPTLMGAISDELSRYGIAVVRSSDLGVDPDHKESLLFALVGFMSASGIPVRLPGSPNARVPGNITPPGPVAGATRFAAVRSVMVGSPDMRTRISRG